MKDKIIKAKVDLLLKEPFFGQLACYLNLIETKEVPTLAVNERGDFFFNADYVEKLSDEEIKSVVCHEILHISYLHPFRCEGRDPMLWNIAADIKVNAEISHWDLPKGSLVPNYRGEFSIGNIKIINCEEKTTEQIYEELLKKAVKIPTFVMDFISGKGEKDAEIGKGELKELLAEWKARTEAALEYAKQRGKVPSGLGRELQQLSEPELPWIRILRERMNKIAKMKSWKRPAKKWLPWYFPGVIRTPSLNLAAALDTSGSMSNEDLRKAMSELWGLARSFPHINMVLYSCDAKVHEKIELKDGNKRKMLQIQMKGGGGTDFRPVFDAVKEDFKDRVDCLLFFTDGFGSFPGNKPSYPVYWVTETKDTTFPFGTVLKLKPSEKI